MEREQLTDAESHEVQAFLDMGIKIPTQPKVLLEIDAIARQPRTNTKAIASLIAGDAGMVSALFKISNSPAFALSTKLDSVESAISVLGLQQVLNLVKCTLLRQTIGGNAPVYEKFWERSADIAQLAAFVAQKQLQICNIVPEQAYMAGLFYECGVPILMQRFPEYGASFRLTVQGGWPQLAEEDRLFDTDHAVVGYLVSRYWRLPSFIGQSIRYHHDIAYASSAARTMVAILQMATHLYNKRHYLADEVEWPHTLPAVLSELGLNVAGVQEFEDDILDSFN